MAARSRSQDFGCGRFLEWCTQMPGENHNKSPHFILQESRCWLSVEKVFDRYCLRLNTSGLSRNFDPTMFTTYVKIGNDNPVWLPAYKFTYSGEVDWLWAERVDDVDRVLREKNCNTVHFIVTCYCELNMKP